MLVFNHTQILKFNHYQLIPNLKTNLNLTVIQNLKFNHHQLNPNSKLTVNPNSKLSITRLQFLKLKQARNLDAELQASEIRLRAERQCGFLLNQMDKAKPSGANQYKDRSHDATAPTLTDMGLTKSQSQRFQQLGV